MDFKEQIKKDHNYEKLYNFIIARYASGQVLNEMEVWKRFRAYYPDDFLNYEFTYLYNKIIETLRSEGKVRVFPGTSEYIINCELQEQKEDNESIKELNKS